MTDHVTSLSRPSSVVCLYSKPRSVSTMTDVLLYSNDLNMFDVFSTTLIQQQQQLMQSNVVPAQYH